MSADFTSLDYAVDRGIATITLNRPAKMNAFTRRMAEEIIAAIDETDRDDDVRAVIFTGAGPRAFCAGADLTESEDTFDFAKRPDGYETNKVGGVFRDTGGLVTLRLFKSLKPLIGAVNGVAVGIGATMLLPMDVRIASTTARFGFVFSRRGIAPDGASSWFLPRVVGIATALAWSISGRIFDAEEAHQRGLVQSLYAPGDLLDAARAIAQELTDHSAPVSVAATRQLMWRMMGASHPMEAHRVDSRIIQDRGASDDAREGVASFLERRSPHFPDLVSAGLPGMGPDHAEPEFY